MKRPLRAPSLVGVFMASILVIAAIATLYGTAYSQTQTQQKSLEVIEVNLEWPNLDPLTDYQEASDWNLMNAIYGELFSLRPAAGCPGGCKNPGEVVPSLAKGYQFSSDGKTFTIDLRPGVTFSDGTPFNAAAVKFNIERDLAPSSSCYCKTNFSVVKSITTPTPTTVQLHLSHRFAPLAEAFVSQAPNWIASPTALKRMGEAAFGQAPVGAGPFVVVANKASTELDLARNTRYFQKGFPLLNKLKFVTVADDEAAFQALQAGTAQVVVGISTPQIIAEAEQKYQVPLIPPVNVSTVEFNTKVAPFDNIKGREAVAYATDPVPIVKQLFPLLGGAAEDLQGPGGLFYRGHVPGYPSYNLAKAKALVQQLGGMSLKLTTVQGVISNELAEALQSEWRQAGINTTITSEPLTNEVKDMENGSWQITVGAAGGPDPDVGIQSIPSRFASNGTLTCCHDPTLDGLIVKTETATSTAARQQAFDHVYAYVARNVYAVDIYTEKQAVIGDRDLKGLEPATGASPAAVPLPWADIS